MANTYFLSPGPPADSTAGGWPGFLSRCRGFKAGPGSTGVLCSASGVVDRGDGGADSVERLLVDPHEGPRLVGFALVLDAAELVAELAVLPLVVVVVLRLPDRLKRSCLVKLNRRRRRRRRASSLIVRNNWEQFPHPKVLITEVCLFLVINRTETMLTCLCVFSERKQSCLFP